MARVVFLIIAQNTHTHSKRNKTDAQNWNKVQEVIISMLRSVDDIILFQNRKWKYGFFNMILHMNGIQHMKRNLTIELAISQKMEKTNIREKTGSSEKTIYTRKNTCFFPNSGLGVKDY